MSNEFMEQIELLSAIGWDLRALSEAQVRTLTAMQRCIEEYRQTQNPAALVEVRRHVQDIEHRSTTHVHEALRGLNEAVAQLEATHP